MSETKKATAGFVGSVGPAQCLCHAGKFVLKVKVVMPDNDGVVQQTEVLALIFDSREQAESEADEITMKVSEEFFKFYDIKNPKVLVHETETEGAKKELNKFINQNDVRFN